MKKTLILLLTLTLSSLVIAQNPISGDARQTVQSGAALGYYVTKDKLVQGIWITKNSLDERTHYIIIPDQPNHPHEILYAGDILEYGFEDDKSKYYSANVAISGKSEYVFLELLISNDSMNIYVYRYDRKELFFQEKGSEPIQLITDSKELQDDFKSMNLNCSKVNIIDRHSLKLKMSSITKMYEAYTRCNVNVFTRFRYGVTGSVYLAKLKIGNNHDFNYKSSAVFSPGLYFEIPIDIRFSFRPEVFYINYKTTGNPNQTIHKLASTRYERKSFLVPLMFRYKVNQLSNKWIPYFELGPTIDIRASGNNYDNYLEKKLYVTRFQFGGALGAGVEYKLTDIISLYAGLRLNASTGTNIYEEKENISMYSFQLSVGF